MSDPTCPHLIYYGNDFDPSMMCGICSKRFNTESDLERDSVRATKLADSLNRTWESIHNTLSAKR
jgi:hypothetical protein